MNQRLISSHSYDADENAGANNHVVSAAATAPSAPPAQVPSFDTAMKASDAPGYGEEPEMGYNDDAFETEPQGHDDSYNDNHHDMQLHEPSGMHSHQERYNVNMKEDG